MNNCVSIKVFLIILISGINVFAGTYSGGDGSSGDPYQIANTDDSMELSSTSGDWAAYFIQTADITFNANEQLVDWDGDGTADWDIQDQLGFSPSEIPLLNSKANMTDKTILFPIFI